jgi:hypothetical protein
VWTTPDQSQFRLLRHRETISHHHLPGVAGLASKAKARAASADRLQFRRPEPDIHASRGVLREEHARAALLLGELHRCLAGSSERRAERVEGPGITPAAG